MQAILDAFGLGGELSGAGDGRWLECTGETRPAVSPVDGGVMATIRQASPVEYDRVVTSACDAFLTWREIPAPKRGEVVRQIGNALRARKAELGALVSRETGKIRAEGEGEVQEMIDIADFSVGQSRMLYGLSMHSERAGHRMYEQWHPLGTVGVVTAFNFPVAPWSWNALVALAAGDAVVWKPSSKAPLCAIAVMKIIWEVMEQHHAPPGIAGLVIGDRQSVGETLLEDRRLPLISATGSVRMGRHVAEVVGRRLGRTILELGGNNAIIVTEQADLDLAVRAITFGAVGTAGQRCTTTRRIIVHDVVYDELRRRLIAAYRQVTIGDPLAPDTLMGPLIDGDAVHTMQAALKRLVSTGGTVAYGGEVLRGGVYDAGTYVTPCICEVPADFDLMREETFAPILYMIRYANLEDAIAIQNGVPQGLSSAIFTGDLRSSERFLGPAGSDCGIANVNIGTSGAEIGGAFGGEKDTGGGRESGSDAWKAYMRRQTCTINWSGELPLAQGIEFDVD